MRACVFVRRDGANGLGHVGWAFEKGNGVFYTGAVENPSGQPVVHPDDIGFWSIKTKNPIGPMKNRKYDSYKVINLRRGNHVRAWSQVIKVKKSWYTLLFGNCMDDTYNVLKEYGVDSMPLPGVSITPNRWYDGLNWKEFRIPSNSSTDKTIMATSDLALDFNGSDDLEDLSDVAFD